MERWSETAWRAASPIYDKILEHQFITEMMDGSLPPEKFEWYIRQDILYMREYARVMNLLADRFTDPRLAEIFRRLAMENIDAERDMHEYLLQNRFAAHDSGSLHEYRTALATESAPAVEPVPSPTCLLLASHLYQIAAEPRLEVAVAAILPCFTVYEKVGRHIHDHSHRDANPYRKWIEAYANPDFAATTASLTEISDKLASANSFSLSLMTDAFVLGTRLEWYFWDAAYNMEKWKI